MALAVSDLINVTVNVSPTAVQGANFGTLLIIGDSAIISHTERVRAYSNITGVLADFANTAPEYLAAQLYFAQIPQPTKLMIGRQDTTESPLAAITACVAASGSWYAAMFSSTTMPTDAENQAVASYVEALGGTHMYGYVTADVACLSTTDTTSLAHTLKGLNLSFTVGQYSSTTPHAIAAFFGRALNVDFTANKTTITMMYKQEVLVTAETLTETQAAGLKANHLNAFVNYNNGSAIVQYGTVSNGRFFDEVHGLSWLQNAVQTAVYNLFYQNPTKIPQTTAGGGLVVSTVASVLDQSVNNGLVAAGTWNSAGFGSLNQGDFLKKGYYVYISPFDSQSQSDREARICPPIQVAVKMAGAIHTVAITINVNR